MVSLHFHSSLLASLSLLATSHAAECGSQVGGKTCPGIDECCSQYGFCDIGDAWCGKGCQSGACYETKAPTPPPTPSMVQPADTATAEHADSRLIAYVGNWQECPTTAQTDAYTHIIVAFAVTYTWTASKNECDERCNIITGNGDGSLTVCGDSVSQELVDSWRDAGKKVLLSIGGAGMGGSWFGDQNNCWDYCFGKEEELSTALVNIVQRQRFDGIDIDYEYCYGAKSDNQWVEKCPQKTELYSDSKAQYFLSTMTTLLRQKLDALGSGYELTHAPMDPDLVPDSPYYQILKDHSPYLNFIMPQFYNGWTQPAADGFDFSVAGKTKTSTVYNNLVNDMFAGAAEKVVFGFCIKDCTGSTNGARAVEVLKQVKAYNGGEFSCNGGAFFWVALTDTGGKWSDPVWEEVKKTSGCSISLNDVDDFEIVVIKFEVNGLMDGETEGIKAEMTTIMNRLFFRLQERIIGMKVSSLEENVSSSANPAVGEEATMYYKVTIMSNDDRVFKTAIIQELRNSYDEILYTIPFSDMTYITNDLDFNWCTTELGAYTLCVHEDPPSFATIPRPGMAPTLPSTIGSNFESIEPLSPAIQSNPNASVSESLPGWAVAIIVVFCLLFLACVGYLIFAGRRRNIADNDQYFDDSSQPWRKQAHDAIAEHESWVTSSQSTPQWNNTTQSAQSIEQASYGSKTAREALGRRARQGHDPTMYRQGHDPTMYFPEQEDRPDPDSSVSGSRRYLANELHSIRPRRDPSVYSVTGSVSSRSRRSVKEPHMKQNAVQEYIPEHEERPDPDSSASISSRYYPKELYSMKAKRDPSVYSETGSISSRSRRSAEKPPMKHNLVQERKPDPDTASVNSRHHSEDPSMKPEPNKHSIS